MKKIILISLMMGIMNCDQSVDVNAGNDNKIFESLAFITVNNNYTNNYTNSYSGNANSGNSNDKYGSSSSSSSSSSGSSGSSGFVDTNTPPAFKKELWFLPSFSAGFKIENYDTVYSQCESRNMRMPSFADFKELATWLDWMFKNRRESSDKFYRFFYDGYPMFIVFVRDKYEYGMSFGFVPGSNAGYGYSYPDWSGNRAGIVICKTL